MSPFNPWLGRDQTPLSDTLSLPLSSPLLREQGTRQEDFSHSDVPRRAWLDLQDLMHTPFQV